MHFLSSVDSSSLELYISYLKSVCSLSKLFSNSAIPYLYYRIAENFFCKSFQAENLSRDDLAYDARINNLGIGIKTFTSPKGISNEKISEFNSFSNQLNKLNGEKLAYKLTDLRNARIDFANRTYGITKSIYHCIARSEKKLFLFDTNYDYINKQKIKAVKSSTAGIQFNDDANEYSYNFSKSTLFKKFYTPKDALTFEIEILNDPYDLIIKILSIKSFESPVFEIPGHNFVILPLYSLRDSKSGKKVVAPKSGLNQWNAKGRPRNFGEVYIPIPSIIHKNFPHFFPSRDRKFNLIIPTKEILSAKVCQENSKALMTNPNKALSDWLLRKVLQLKEGELLKYEKLKFLGIDSVKITKIDNSNFKIDFVGLDSYDNFEKYMKLNGR